ncbi:MAG: DegV family protein [Oscillospiraceae bacterium]|nr:DegV family protein [Oscillospiraceae bacterium]
MFQIISDGGCDFSKDEAKKHSVEVVPFYISFDDVTHLKEGVDVSKEDFFKRLMADKGLFPKTSQPSPQDYIDVYTPHLDAGKDILTLTISSKLSGSHASAVMAADMLKEEYPDRTIILIDSLNVSIGQGLILGEIIKMRDAGYSIQKTTKLAKKILTATRVYCTLNSLEYLRRGGRIGPTTAVVGGILGLRPILQLEDGEVSQLDSVRGKKNAMKLIAKALVAVLKDKTEQISLSIGHILSEEDAIAFKSEAETALSMKIESPITEVGVTIGSHAGPGALAFAYCGRYEVFERGEKA